MTIATGAVEPVTEGLHDVAAYSATADGATIAATLSTQTNIGDIFVGDRPQITHVNADLFKDIQQSEPEEIWYKSFDGKTSRAGS